MGTIMRQRNYNLSSLARDLSGLCYLYKPQGITNKDNELIQEARDYFGFVIDGQGLPVGNTFGEFYSSSLKREGSFLPLVNFLEGVLTEMDERKPVSKDNLNVSQNIFWKLSQFASRRPIHPEMCHGV
ncbi:MAG: hypothetical protein ABIA78_04410 [archaeon]